MVNKEGLKQERVVEMQTGRPGQDDLPKMRLTSQRDKRNSTPAGKMSPKSVLILVFIT